MLLSEPLAQTISSLVCLKDIMKNKQ